MQGKFKEALMGRIKKRFGFSLAETLLTLAIIGVVAAMTIPILSNSYQDSQYKSAYKKAYSDAANIWQQMANNNEIDYCPWKYDTTCGYAHFTEFKKYLTISKDCPDDQVAGCWDVNGEALNEVKQDGSGGYRPTRPDGGFAHGFVDNSGRSWIMPNAGYSGEYIMVDTNGFSKPNKFGKDRFYFIPITIDNSRDAGYRIKLKPLNDYTYVTATCGYPPCYYTKWLYN